MCVCVRVCECVYVCVCVEWIRVKIFAPSTQVFKFCVIM